MEIDRRRCLLCRRCCFPGADTSWLYRSAGLPVWQGAPPIEARPEFFGSIFSPFIEESW